MSPAPDVVVLTDRAEGVAVTADRLAPAVEIWSPGNSRAERETKTAGYAMAGVPCLWTVSDGELTAHRLVDSQYEAADRIPAGGTATLTAGPVPVTIDLTGTDR